jgi:phosphoribosylanthranilate isomerase
MHIKLCGFTTLDDALAAADLGVDMLGFNFYQPSPRCIEPDGCARIIAALRGRGFRVTTVGVFVNSPEAEVTAIAERCGLDLLQLHGDEPPEMLAALGPRAFKAIRPASILQAMESITRYRIKEKMTEVISATGGPALAADAPALLLDAAHPGLYGGTGQAADWSMAAALATEYPLLLAGGLTPDNVAAAVAQVHPWGVDAASGVELRPGIKDRAKIAAFVRAADSERISG